MHWIVDNANLVYFLLIAALLIMLAAGWSTRRSKYWGYAGVVGGLVVLLWLITKLVITDRQQVVLNLEAMSSAIVNKNPDAVLKYVSKDFRYGRLNREELFKLIDASVQRHNVDYVKLWDQHVTVTGDTAEARFNFRADAAGKQYPASAEAKFVRENGDWRLKSVNVFKIGTTERQHVPGVD